MEKAQKNGLLTVPARRVTAGELKDFKMMVYAPQQPKEGKIISYEKISASDEAGIVRLYKMLVPENIGQDICIEQLVEKAIPVFEEFLGKAAWQKVKKFFEIGGKYKTKPTAKEIEQLVGKLRTVENAMLYINGYEELINNVASRVGGAPADMSNLVKAKILRAFVIIFSDYHFFTEDFKVVKCMDRDLERVLNNEKILENNKKPVYPEELFFLFKNKISFFKENSFSYERMVTELLAIDKRNRKEVFEIAELAVTPEKIFVSTNKPAGNHTFGTIRNLKMRVNPIRGEYPVESFCTEMAVEMSDWGFLYSMHKILESTADWKTFPTTTKMAYEIEGARLVSKKREFYVIGGELFSGIEEIKLFERYFWYVVDKNYMMKTTYIDEQTGETSDIHKKTGVFMSAIQFARELEYISKETDIDREFDVADKIIEKIGEESLLEYRNGVITADELKERFRIDTAFEKTILNIKKKENPMEVAIRFAMENGYCDSEAADEALVTEVIVSGNEELWEKYSEEEIDTKTLKRKLGFDESFAKMYFALRNIDISNIEQKLLSIKKSFSGKDKIKENALLIKLYCYLVENQIPCGAKMKAPKRNKALKTSILKELATN